MAYKKTKKYIVCPGTHNGKYFDSLALMREHDVCLHDCLCLEDFKSSQEFVDRLNKNDLWRIAPGIGELAPHQKKHTKKKHESISKQKRTFASLFGRDG